MPIPSVPIPMDPIHTSVNDRKAGARKPGSQGSNDPRPPEIYLGVKHGILTPYFWKETSSGTVQLILSKIIKIVATIRQILRLKCTQFDFGWGFAPDPAVAAYSSPPRPPS